MVHAEGGTWNFQPSRSPENAFPALKSEANSFIKNVKMKKVIHFTDFFLC